MNSTHSHVNIEVVLANFTDTMLLEARKNTEDSTFSYKELLCNPARDFLLAPEGASKDDTLDFFYATSTKAWTSDYAFLSHDEYIKASVMWGKTITNNGVVFFSSVTYSKPNKSKSLSLIKSPNLTALSEAFDLSILG